METVDLNSARGRMLLAGLTLGTGVAILDGSVVNVALRTIGDDLGASLEQLQWIVNGYLLSLAALVLLAGALGDRLGRKRIYLLGVAWFAGASLLCAFAQSPAQLIALRVLQGVGGALLTPGALALIQASFPREQRPAAIGTWAGAAGIGGAIGPLLGGVIVGHASWRWIFAINVPLCLVAWLLTWRSAPESRAPQQQGRFDVMGAALAAISLGASTYILTASAQASAGEKLLWWGLAIVAGVGFVVRERRTPHPMVPMSLFSSRLFSVANAMTLLVYAALGAVFFFVVIQLQVSAGWTPLASGLSGLPVTIAMALLSSRAAQLAAKIGPRLPMTLGPLICAAGTYLLSRIGPGAGWVDVLPGMVVFALGLSLLVSPLTAAVLSSVDDAFAGVASGINNAVARTGSLLSVAALPALVGLSGDDYANPATFTPGFRSAMLICVGLLVAGGVISWFLLAPEDEPSASSQAA